jgi:hypothetical protein
MTKPRMIDELAHAGPEHLDPSFVAGFDRKQGYPDPAEDLGVLRGHTHMPDRLEHRPGMWIRNDIYKRHQDYLAVYGGHRPNNPASEHHLITIARVAEWQDTWDVLGIFAGSRHSGVMALFMTGCLVRSPGCGAGTVPRSCGCRIQ